mmetsp:Transcript_10085/g.24830  ORF Transcript_10085/g.24830 Transcript_10085/m.24830 type:complete len:89 (+) Transcript_10085:2111-2377(+)
MSSARVARHVNFMGNQTAEPAQLGNRLVHLTTHNSELLKSLSSTLLTQMLYQLHHLIIILRLQTVTLIPSRTRNSEGGQCTSVGFLHK